MRSMKLALLSSVALFAASVGARADNLVDLKAQVEALNARVASAEATPSVPAGYSLVTFSKGQNIHVPGYYEANKNNGTAHVILIIPSAGAPAAAGTVITWSGWVRGAMVTGRNVNTIRPTVSYVDAMTISGTEETVISASMFTATTVTKQHYSDIRVRGEVVVSGKTDTAVGEVGARLALETAADTTDSFGLFNGGNSGAVTTDGFWGWWKMTPNLTLGAGIDGSLAKNGKSFDAACTCYYEGTGGPISNNPNGASFIQTDIDGYQSGTVSRDGTDPAQIRLSFADGPLAFAVAVEDSNNTGSSSAFGGAAKATWSSDIISADLSGGYWGNTVADSPASWAVNAGVGVSLGSLGSISAVVGTGANSTTAAFLHSATYTKAGGFLKLSLTDLAHAEIGGAYTWNQKTTLNAATIGGGIYYDPVKQFTIGAEGSYVVGGSSDGTYVADLVTVFRF